MEGWTPLLDTFHVQINEYLNLFNPGVWLAYSSYENMYGLKAYRAILLPELLQDSTPGQTADAIPTRPTVC